MNDGNVRFRNDDALGTGGEFRLRRARVYIDGKHVGNIYAWAALALKHCNRHTQPDAYFYAPLGKFNQPAFHGLHFPTLAECKRSLT